MSELNHNSFDLVVLDVCMPGIDGLQTLKKIKKTWPLIEVILLTGHACAESARQGNAHLKELVLKKQFRKTCL